MNEWESETRQFYGEKGLGSRIGWGKRPALIVIDLANGFTHSESPLGGDLDAQVAATPKLLTACRRSGHPVIFTTVAYRPDYSDGATFVEKVPALKVLLEGSKWIDIDDRIRPEPDEPVVVKKFASAFFGTDVAERLNDLNVDTVLLAGCSTSGCVRASAIDAMQYGFRTLVVEQAVGDRAEGPHRANLFDMDSKYADVIDIDNAIEQLKALAASTV